MKQLNGNQALILSQSIKEYVKFGIKDKIKALKYAKQQVKESNSFMASARNLNIDIVTASKEFLKLIVTKPLKVIHIDKLEDLEQLLSYYKEIGLKTSNELHQDSFYVYNILNGNAKYFYKLKQ